MGDSHLVCSACSWPIAVVQEVRGLANKLYGHMGTVGRCCPPCCSRMTFGLCLTARQVFQRARQDDFAGGLLHVTTSACL